MKWSRFITPRRQTVFVPGDWNSIDDRFGTKVKASSTSLQWDKFRTVAAQRRHEQDFIRSTNETIRTPFSRPEPTDGFINQGAVVLNGNFYVDEKWTKGSSWTIDNGYATYTAGSTE
ncbi:MAG: hypothetical protein IH932_04185 [Thaumarchaeota archaeon]|nr:hypothetical protein [Nitrososphaerota archaeon]